MKTVLEYLEYSAAVRPHAVAVEDAGGTATFQELEVGCRKVGSALTERIALREPVAIFLEKGRQALWAFWGTVYAGGFYVPLNPDLPPARLRQIQSVLQANYVITDRAHRVRALEIFSPEAILDVEELLAAPLQPARLEAVRSQVVDTDPLYTNFTSGSTGQPKGVVVSHRSVIDFIDTFVDCFGMDHTDILANQAPFDFDVSVKDLYTMLKTGAKLSVVPKELFSRPKELLDWLCDRKVTSLTWAVSALCLISTFHGLDYRVPETVRRVLFSGEVMPEKHLRAWRTHLPEAVFVNLYGPTEITCNCTYYRVGRVFSDGEKIPAGRAFPGRTVFLMDEDGHEIAQPGRTGEICAAGESLASGYYRDREQTEKKFIRFPVHGGGMQRVYRTGDLGYYDASGELVFAGRKDFQIKHMGHRIELEEVESAMNAVPGVTKSCCVFDRKQNRICGFYMGNVTGSQVRRYMKERVPVYMVPSGIRQVAAMPLTKNGKTDREYFLRLAVQARQENDRGKEKI